MPWTAVRHASLRHPDVYELSGTRRVFRDQYGYVLYMGERVVRQYRWGLPVRVPQPPPRFARMPSRMAIADFEALRVGVPVEELFEEGQDYGAFLEERVMTMATPVSADVLRQRAFGAEGAGVEVPVGGGIGEEIPGDEDVGGERGASGAEGAGAVGGSGAARTEAGAQEPVIEEMTGGRGSQAPLDILDFLGRESAAGAGSSAAEAEMRGYLRGLAEGQQIAEEAMDRARESAYTQGREAGHSQGLAESGVAGAILPEIPGYFSWMREGVTERFEIQSSLLPAEVPGVLPLTGFDDRSVSLVSFHLRLTFLLFAFHTVIASFSSLLYMFSFFAACVDG